MTAGGVAAGAPWAATGTAPGALLPPWMEGTPQRIALAVVLIVAGVYLSKYFVRLLERPVTGRIGRESIVQMVLGSIRMGVVVVAVVTAASLFGFRPTDLLVSVTVFSAVLGIILAPIVGNVINGLFVLADQPFEIGDMIELQNGTRGFVDDITLRYTKVFTIDNTFTVIPNASIRDQQVVNYSAEDRRTRLSLPVLVTYESDIDAARTLFERAARSCEGVIDGGPDIRIGAARYPAKPTAYIDEYADSGVLIRLRYWAVQPYRLLTIRSEVQTAIWDLLAESDADVEIAYPHRQLVFGDGTDASRAVEESLRDESGPSRSAAAGRTGGAGGTGGIGGTTGGSGGPDG
ncbi:MAG: mechanosensitive ion channel family protein [Haloferacaceae archaeon]